LHPSSAMAVRLVFVRPHAEPLPSGDYREVRLSLADLTADGEVLATYTDNRWQVRGAKERFSAIEFHSRVNAHFERKNGERSKPFGPYASFRLMDGVAYASGHVFAFFDKQQHDWYSLALGHHWRAMILLAASGEPHEVADAADDSATE
jgi:hypothetical protein